IDAEPSDVSDDEEIRALIGAHFDEPGWNEGELPDRDRFLTDFHPDAVLNAAARPAQKRSPPEFVERMNGVATGAIFGFSGNPQRRWNCAPSAI
ncbi:MAG: hypothetical protein LJE62_10090, partial [Silicimonas sp.]|nr:hypothetical protein [Silicimonas sp.]